jgi:putative endonuclease
VSDQTAIQSRGKQGEELAARELERRGYAIVATRFRTRCGEIDIVARDGDVLVFVEVKTRADDACGTAAEAVTRRKQRKVTRMAAAYLAAHETRECACRFDVVTVEMRKGARPEVTVYQAAFDA